MPALSDAGSATEWGRKDGAPGFIFALIPVPSLIHFSGATSGKEDADMAEMQFPLALESEKEVVIAHITANLDAFSFSFLDRLDQRLAGVLRDHQQPRPHLQLIPHTQDRKHEHV